MKSLSEVVKLVGITRRVIQEYEDAGLANRPTETNKYGHLLYDAERIRRLWQLRFYRELDFDKKDIIEFEKNKDEEKKLDDIIESLINKREKIDNLISIAKGLKKNGLGLDVMQREIFFDEDIEFNLVLNFIGPAFESMLEGIDTDGFELNEDEFDLILESLCEIAYMCETEEATISEDVQKEVSVLHSVVAKRFSDSVTNFKTLIMVITDQEDVAKAIDKVFGKGRIEKCKKAILYYCKKNKYSGFDKLWQETFDKIEKLAFRKVAYSSKEIQDEIEKLYSSLLEVGVLTESDAQAIMRNLTKIFTSKSVKKSIDKNRERGIVWFVGKAFETYCNKLAQVNKGDSDETGKSTGD